MGGLLLEKVPSELSFMSARLRTSERAGAPIVRKPEKDGRNLILPSAKSSFPVNKEIAWGNFVHELLAYNLYVDGFSLYKEPGLTQSCFGARRHIGILRMKERTADGLCHVKHGRVHGGLIAFAKHSIDVAGERPGVVDSAQTRVGVVVTAYAIAAVQRRYDMAAAFSARFTWKFHLDVLFCGRCCMDMERLLRTSQPVLSE
jgi:hypothetical protein